MDEPWNSAGTRGIMAYISEPHMSTVMSTLRREPILSLAIPQKATDAIPTTELRALTTPMLDAEKPTP